MREWHNLMHKVLVMGEEREDRTGVGTRSLFGQTILLDNSGNSGDFPAVTTKELFFEQVKAELACFVRGLSTLEEFHQFGCKIWDGNGSQPDWAAHHPGQLGRIYGVQWRDWQSAGNGYAELNHTDQLKSLIEGLKLNPQSRRHVVTAFNPGELDQMCLPPCHLMFQCYVSRKEHLDMAVYMRSCDLFLGLPFDIASFALLQRLLAQDTGLKSQNLRFFFGDAHIYTNHKEQVREVLSREPYEPPALDLSLGETTLDFHPERANLVGYQHHPAVRAPLNI